MSDMVKVKVCGITNLDDALAAVAFGADALGYIFAPSPRRVIPAVVKDIVAELPPFVVNVGVFVNNELAEVQEIMSLCGLDRAQLHGNENPEYCAALFPRAIKVFTAATLPSLKDLTRYRVAAFMLDMDKGTTVKDKEQEQLWQLARETGEHGPVILAGGLTPENIGRAIEIARPYAVDVSSGVEAEPGRKDHAKLRAFLMAATAGASHINNPVGADPCVCPDHGQSHGIAPTTQGKRESR